MTGRRGDHAEGSEHARSGGCRPAALSPGLPFGKRLRYRLEHFGLELAAAIIPRLPRWLLLRLAELFGAAAWLFDSRSRRVALSNLECALPGLSGEERGRVARTSLQIFARTMLDLFWAPNFRRDTYSKYVSVRMLGIGKPPAGAAIYYCFHFGNFEWLSFISAFEIQSGIIIAQRFHNPLIGPVFNRLRALPGHDIIPQERALVRMLKLLKAGGKFGVLTDLNIDPREGGVPVRCFGMWSSLSPLAAVLAQKTGARIVPCEAFANPGGRCEMVYHEPLEVPEGADLQAVTQQCWDALEPSIRSRPEQWLWAYKHWRYRPTSPDRPYPFYANPSPRFEALIQSAPDV